MLRIELDDLSRAPVLALLEEHLRNMYELSPPEKVLAFDAGRLKAPGVTFWTAWDGESLLGCATGFAPCEPLGPYRENGNSVFMSLRLA